MIVLRQCQCQYIYPNMWVKNKENIWLVKFLFCNFFFFCARTFDLWSNIKKNENKCIHSPDDLQSMYIRLLHSENVESIQHILFLYSTFISYNVNPGFSSISVCTTPFTCNLQITLAKYPQKIGQKMKKNLVQLAFC